MSITLTLKNISQKLEKKNELAQKFEFFFIVSARGKFYSHFASYMYGELRTMSYPE